MDLNTLHMIAGLEWSAFRRIGLLWTQGQNTKTNRKINADLKLAKADNAETDKFIKQYCLEARLNWLTEIPF